MKIIDACGLTCTFCHNEGTPVVIDNRLTRDSSYVSAGRSGRVSIYAGTNGVTFLPSAVPADDRFRRALDMLRQSLALTEVHFTGGEPTRHPAVDGLTAIAAEAGFVVGMTSNGERGDRVIGRCAVAGLDRVNFSIFGTTPAELADAQHPRLRDERLAARKIDALRRSIELCAQHGVTASANIVVPDLSHAARVHRLLDEYSPHLSVRLLNSLDHGTESIEAIGTILHDRGAVLVERHLIAGVSAARAAYRLPDGRTVLVKQIRHVRLPVTCAGCRFNNDRDCHEGFYGVRLYYDQTGRYQVGVCIRRMDLCLPLDEFVVSSLPGEILTLRTREQQRLTELARHDEKDDVA